MGDRNYKEREVRSIQKSNGTYYITIPKELIGQLGWRERQKVTVTKRNKNLIISDWS